MNNQEKGYYRVNQESIVAKLEKLVEDYTREAEEAEGRLRLLQDASRRQNDAKKC